MCSSSMCNNKHFMNYNISSFVSSMASYFLLPPPKAAAN